MKEGICVANPHICWTKIKFFGDKDALDDLFGRIHTDWLDTMLGKFYLEEGFLKKYNDDFITRGFVTDIDANHFTISQKDVYVPKIRFWDAVIDLNYTPCGNRIIDYVYTAECPFGNIYVNTDVKNTYFDFRFSVFYKIDGEEDIVRFKSGAKLQKWCKDKFNIEADSLTEINELMLAKLSDTKTEYFRAIRFDTKLR